MSLAGKVAINVSALVAGRLLNAATGVVAVAIAARYLHPAAYGSLITGIAFTAALGALTDLGTTTIGAREIAKRPDERDRILAAIFTISAGLGVLALAVGVGASQLFYQGEAHALEREAVLLLLLPTVLLPFAATAGTYFISEQKNYMSMAASVLGSLSLFALVVGAVELDWGFTGVAAAYTANGLVFGLAMGAFGLRWGVAMRPALDRALCVQLLRWALPLGAALMIGALYLRLDVILLSVMKPDSEVGPYGLAFKIVDVLLILPAYMMLTLLPELARLSEHRDRLGEIIQKAFSVMQTVVVPLTILFVVFADEIVEILGGGRFESAGPILQVLMIAVAFSYFGSICFEALVALNQQRSVMVLTGTCLVLNAALNVALIPPLGGMGSAIAYAASEVVLLGFVFSRFARVGSVPHPVNLPGFLAAGAAMASAGLVFKLIPGVDDAPAPVILVGGGLLSVSAYVLTLYGLRAVPDVVQDSLVLPLWARLRRSGART